MLRAITGPLAGATFEVGVRVLIGRIPACDILLADVEVSREHAMLVADAGQIILVDLTSRNGTFVDGEQVRRRALRPGDTFSIAASRFVFDDTGPISTRPVLASTLSRAEQGAASTRVTRETAAPSEVSEDDDTKRSIPAASSEATSRPTVRLEAATSPEPRRDKDTAELQAVGRQAPASMMSEPPPSFSPPPVRKAVTKSAPRGQMASYPGDLLADVTAYRSFRLRLQRGEMPSGEEVASMIDLEAALREPPPDASPLRDVVTQRFFRRFAFPAPLLARFTASGQVAETSGTVVNLSVDGLRCELDLGGLRPRPDQLAMLVIDHAAAEAKLRYSVTARVVYHERGVVGFVFAGVPSRTQRGAFEHAETAVRMRVEPPTS